MSDVSKSKAKYEGKVFTSTNSGDFKVVEYIDPRVYEALINWKVEIND